MQLAIDELIAFLSRSEQVKNLTRIADRAGFAPDFPDFGITQLIPFVEKSEVAGLNEIEEFIENKEPEIADFFKDIRSKIAIKWSASPAFLCVLVLVRKFPNVFNLDFLVSNGFEEAHAKIVLSALERQRHR
jgi:hypothetical protein